MPQTLFFLAGLESSEDNFMWKAGSLALKFASQNSMIIVTADTSPRGVGPKTGRWDLGEGASFYVDALAEEYSNYQMSSYITKELYELIKSNFPVDGNRIGIFGHSMGGHGALTLGMKNPQLFKSISAFAPICNPVKVRVGIDCFTHYLGPDGPWKQYDATELIKSGLKYPGKILVDTGSKDPFLHDYLLSENLITACKEHNIDLQFNWREGYDHSYYFISTFVENHLAFHLEQLNKV